uniref:CCHC-type domain-containing protein n=1 Tax=Phocoena sinus TaxID=42100 RepID=A0A8C9DZL9_PHOSS
MGNSLSMEPSAGFHEPIQALLNSRGLKLSHKAISKLLQDIDGAAPWFAVSGSLTVPSWEKLGKDLADRQKMGELSRGTFPLWRMIHSCLREGKCEDIVQMGRKALSIYQDSASESENIGTTVDRPKNPRKKREKQIEKSDATPGLYPLLDEFKALYLSQDELNPKEEADLEEAAAEYERGRPPFCASAGARPPFCASAKSKALTCTQTSAFIASASPGAAVREPPECTFIPREVWSQVPTAFPVFEDPATCQRHYEMVDHKILKDLAEAARGYGITANYTLMLLQRLTRNALTPTDWHDIARACLSMGQYLDWKSIVADLAYSQARENAANGQPAWNAEMLLGQGQWLNNQTVFPTEVYGQINQIGMQAWRALPNKGEVTGNLTKIIQGSTEPFSDFVARMMEAAGRIFGSVDDALPLVKQLLYEQSTKECRRAITPIKGKSLEAWMKMCREIGGPLSNAGLAAAVMAATNNAKPSGKSGVCFQCGRPGHIKRQCREMSKKPNMPPQKTPGTCPRCKKGKHWANECRSVKDINGQPIPSATAFADSGNAYASSSKNGMKGPRSQGPNIFGAHEIVSFQPPKPRGEPRQDPQGWTSVPPPEWY